MKKFMMTAAALLFSASTAQAIVAATPTGVEPADLNTVTLNMAGSVLKAQEDKNDNLILSPYNIITNMALVASGAAGKTQEEMAAAIFGRPLPADDATRSLAALNASLLAANKGTVDLLTANGIWVNRKMAALSDSYAAQAQDNFGAAADNVDFADKATVDSINKWASDNTKGLISKIVQELKPDDAMVLASALYFKGKWAFPFDKTLTEDKTFTADGGKKFKTPMMQREFDSEGDIAWKEGTDYVAVALSYGTEDKRPMRLILLHPKEAAVTARDWLAGKTGDTGWFDGYEGAQGKVELPRIDITQHHDLVPALKDIGIKTAFTGSADFKPMVTKESAPLFISAVSHDIVFKTDEEGSEAAAITTTKMAGSAAPREPKIVNLKFDRSFVFALQDISTNLVLFVGAVNKPNGEMKPE
ncbi:MAG: serpin family protein [Alphaproteobacteria bacterium]